VVAPGIALVCLDFDGTVVIYEDSRTFFHAAAIQALNRLEDSGVRWCTNSGRDDRNQVEILENSRARGLRHMPEALLCSESFIFIAGADDYVSLESWNHSAQKRLGHFHRHVQAVLRHRLDDWDARYHPQTYIGPQYTVFRVEDVNAQTGCFHAELCVALSGIAHARVSRNGSWLSVLPEHLGKGNVLRNYLRVTRTQPERVLAIGDHLNDLGMLDGSAAELVGCPANAVPEVMRAVAGAGGFVAGREGAEGTADVIGHFMGWGA
jgi:hydroxymethylpyrimidine pyrophosphatase-like HAD family hydrolase